MCIRDRLKNGDREEYKKIYRDCFRDVYKHIIKNSGTFIDAESIMQEAMIVLLKKVRSSKFILTTSICKYLKGIVNNLWLDALKKQKTKGELGIRKLQDFHEELFLPDDTESWKFPKEKKDKMWRVLKTLSKKCQQILLSKHVYELLSLIHI